MCPRSQAGSTVEQALPNIREAIEFYLEPVGDIGKGAKVVAEDREALRPHSSNVTCYNRR